MKRIKSRPERDDVCLELNRPLHVMEIYDSNGDIETMVYRPCLRAWPTMVYAWADEYTWNRGA